MEIKPSIKRGIYLVANLKSETYCENLVYSIRQSGCTLPIRLIPFGGAPVQSPAILSQVELYNIDRFPPEALNFINQLQTVLVDCPRGFLLRFLAWFGDWEEFLYSDNDIVAFMNWEKLFTYLNDVDLVHADEEYITEGKFNYDQPLKIAQLFGEGALLTAFTAGHFVARRKQSFISDMRKAIEWFKANPSIPKKHDQALMHVASLIGSWKTLNLCRMPHNWLSPWAGDHVNSLSVIQAIQQNGHSRPISHIHYSGDKPSGTLPIDDFLFASADQKSRLRTLVTRGAKELTGISYLLRLKQRIIHRVRLVVSK